MICSSCRRSLLSSISRTQIRRIATTPTTSNASPVSPPPPSSTGVSTETPPSTSTTKLPSSTSATTPPLKKTNLQSSIPGGVELKGLGYLKAKPHIIAKEDDEYPPWLWTLLDTKKQTDGKSAVDLAELTKKQRLKHERKQARLMKDIPTPIPIHEQSNDLTQPEDSADVSLRKRQEVTKSAREARRKSIRESNFLKGM